MSRLRPAVPRRLAPHVLILVAVLLLIAAASELRAPFTVDDGLYATEAHALSHGHWGIPYRFAAEDPAGRYFPLVNASHAGETWYPYVKQPVYARVVAWSSAWFGEVFGLYVPALAGVVLAAAAAWLLASLLAPNLRVASYWVVAASPVLVNGLSMWAHAPSAAAGGFAVAGAIAAGRGGRRWAWPVLLVGTAVGALLRAEGLLFGVALAVGVVLLSRRRAAVAALGSGAAVAVTAVVAYQVAPWWSRAITGSAATAVTAWQSSGSFVGGRLQGAWRSLLQGSSGDAVGSVLGVLALGAVMYAAWTIRRRREGWARDAAVALGVFVALLAARVAVAPEDAITGLLAAWPFAAAAVVLARWREVELERRVLAGVVALYAAAVLATQYREAGGLEWGGRFFSPVVPLVGILAVTVVADALRSLPVDRRPWMVRGAVVVAAAPVLAGVFVIGLARGRAHDLVAEVDRAGPRVVVTDNLPLPRMAWSVYDRHDWLLARSASDVSGALSAARAARVTRLLLVTQSPIAPDATLGGYWIVADDTGPAAHRYDFRLLELAPGR